MLIWSEALLPRPPFKPTSWHLSNQSTHWLSTCKTGQQLPRGSKIKGPCPDDVNNSAVVYATCPHKYTHGISMFRSFHQKATSATRYGARAFSMSYWRSQSRKWFIISYNHLNMTGRQAPSERRSRPWLREWEGPAAVAVGGIAPTGRTAPKAPVGITCPKFLWFQNYKWSGFWGHKDLKIIIEI